MDISAIFEFIADNPPIIAIAGGILMWIAGSIMKGGGLGADLLFWAPFVFFSGVGLQVLWLYFRYR